MGYWGKDLAQIKQIAEKLDATVFDIRYSPGSRNPQFRGRRMAEALGDRYMHVRAFGNKNYKGGPIQILDFASGLNMVIYHPRQNIILLCVCKDPKICHRTIISNKLRDCGYTVEEYIAEDTEPTQLALDIKIS